MAQGGTASSSNRLPEGGNRWTDRNTAFSTSQHGSQHRNQRAYHSITRMGRPLRGCRADSPTVNTTAEPANTYSQSTTHTPSRTQGRSHAERDSRPAPRGFSEGKEGSPLDHNRAMDARRSRQKSEKSNRPTDRPHYRCVAAAAESSARERPCLTQRTASGIARHSPWSSKGCRLGHSRHRPSSTERTARARAKHCP